jgi:hypothetical protein
MVCSLFGNGDFSHGCYNIGKNGNAYEEKTKPKVYEYGFFWSRLKGTLHFSIDG